MANVEFDSLGSSLVRRDVGYDVVEGRTGWETETQASWADDVVEEQEEKFNFASFI